MRRILLLKKNSERIDAKILEVSDSEVSYKKTDYIDGPTFIVKTSEISSIIYSNGEVQAFIVSDNKGSNNGKIRFNSEPVSRKRPFGLSIGYVSKQCNNMGLKIPWVYYGSRAKKVRRL